MPRVALIQTNKLWFKRKQWKVTFYYCNNNVDILFSAHNAFLEYPSSGTFKVKILESQIILKSLNTRKPKDLKRIAKIGYGHIYLREEHLSYSNNDMI
jgi:hypothetical protein